MNILGNANLAQYTVIAYIPHIQIASDRKSAMTNIPSGNFRNYFHFSLSVILHISYICRYIYLYKAPTYQFDRFSVVFFHKISITSRTQDKQTFYSDKTFYIFF